VLYGESRVGRNAKRQRAILLRRNRSRHVRIAAAARRPYVLRLVLSRRKPASLLKVRRDAREVARALEQALVLRRHASEVGDDSGVVTSDAIRNAKQAKGTATEVTPVGARRTSCLVDVVARGACYRCPADRVVVTCGPQVVLRLLQRARLAFISVLVDRSND